MGCTFRRFSFWQQILFSCTDFLKFFLQIILSHMFKSDCQLRFFFYLVKE
ncbi:hypothetical protein ACJIZ3_021385 [Penstemon smallii]|uniref:Uncharacterized protein n=1 Tax=Penstemon smallii TaxID=265156 RepID=A0ABD3SLW3_9LAMI